EHPPVLEVAKPKTKVPLRLPEENFSNDEIINYLVNKRKLNLELIYSLIEGGLIYQERHSNNVVFVGFDLMCEPRFACKRGIDSNFKQDCLGSNKAYSFNLSNENNTELHVFESAIDLLSFITLEMMKNNEYKKSNYLSLSGVGDSESFLPISLCSYLDRYPHIKKIVLHLDNDNAGKSSTDNIIHCCDGIYETEDQHPINYKDVNEELINLMKENE
ncbi:toprim domain-containing protein, partial [Holdemanella porci]|uniref:toprim domain-containing protein n=1 Tax=Holdemanella porci TaxID=2652276 RepID=UPI003AB2103C